MSKKPILCLDFDGVIHGYQSGWLGADVIIDPPVPGALEALVNYTYSFEVHIYSSRSESDEGICAMQKWLLGHLMASKIQLPYKQAAKSFVGGEYEGTLKWPTKKPPAMISIDDRAITFTGDWPAAQELLAFKPWNKK